VTALVLLVAAGIGITHIGDVVTYSDGLEAGRRASSSSYAQGHFSL